MQIKVFSKGFRPAFALPAVLLISTGVLILLVALMTIVELERTTSKARLGAYQADLAVESGLEEAKMILAQATASNTFAVGVIEFGEEFDDNGDGDISSEEDANVSGDEHGRPYLYAIQGEVDDGDVNYRMTPLFSTDEGSSLQSVNIDGELSLPRDPGLSLENESNLENRVAVRGTPHIQAPVTSWRVIRDQEGVPVARYSYWVEDLQGYLDAEMVGGNERGGGVHARANQVWKEQSGFWNPNFRSIVENYIAAGGEVPLWPAPGINPSYDSESDDEGSENSLLSEVAVYTLDQSKEGRIDESDFDDDMRELTPMAPTPASLLALSGVEAPLERVAIGSDRGRVELRGSNPEPRWIEESFVSGNRSWDEQAMIPFVPGIDPSMMGEPRLNLNEQLESLGGTSSLVDPVAELTAVQAIAEHVAAALPNFSPTRRGGFGEWETGDAANEAYLNTLAACMIDYADQNNVPTMEESSYRGIDSYPMISEYLITHRYEEFEDIDGANFLVITVETFAELWNMSNHAVTGTFELGYVNPYTFEALGNPEVEFMTPLEITTPSNAQSWSTHNLTRSADDGRWFSNPTEITIPSNGHTLVSTGPVVYHLLISPSGEFLPPPIELTFLEGAEVANYHLKWNGTLCDRSGGGLELTSKTLNWVLDIEQVTRAVICGTWGEFGNFYSGMYDLRQSWWAGLDNEEGVVSENSYPQNYSPGRRTVRYGSIASNDEDALHGRVLVSSWPDGGHDASFDLSSFHERSSGASDRALRPDSPELYTGDVAPESLKAPVFLSNLGHYISETEIANIFDPHMWRHRTNPSRTQEIWYQGTANAGVNNDVPEVQSSSRIATVVGGGNTLRIGRPEHEAFDEVGVRASHLLDLFHCGDPHSSILEQRTNLTRKVAGHVNINTASREVLRSLVAGILTTDPAISLQLTSFDTRTTFAPRVSEQFEEISATDAIMGEGGVFDEGGAIADAIIAGRPYVSRSQLANLVYPETVSNLALVGEPVFGNKLNHGPEERLQVSDRALEETFARIYNSTTVRSRNYRIHVIGQALEQTPSGNLNVKSTRKKSYRVFVDPGEQDSEFGFFEPEKVTVETIYETNL